MTEASLVSEKQAAFGKRYGVDITKPLTEFNTVGGVAYAVIDKEDSSVPLYAFVQKPEVPVRYNVLDDLKGNKIKGLVCPLDYGVMALELDVKCDRFVIIFERPMGGSLFIGKRVNKRVNIALLRSALPLAFASTLVALHNEGITHRHIRPANIFFMNENSDEDIVLGECVTSPPGFGAPVDLEPMELMFADGASRGYGTVAADMYQMGVSLLTLYKNRPIWEKRARETALKTRVSQGSFQALVAGEDLSGSIVNLIKGLMDDDITNRWSISDVLNWFEGNNKRRVHSKESWILNRAIVFNEETYTDKRMLADAFSRAPKKAIKFLEGLDFSTWLAETIRSEVLEERVELLLAVKKKERTVADLSKHDYALLSRVCVHLHPGGPIRYKGLSLMADSLSSTVSGVLSSDSKETYNALKELLDDRYLSILAEIVGERDMNFFNQIGALKKATGTAQSLTLGRGLERVLYNTNKLLPCQSKRFANFFIDDAGKFASALNKSDRKDAIKSAIFDRHVAAFLASRSAAHATIINNFAITERDPSRFSVIALDFFGRIQNEFELPAMTHLTSMLIEGLRASISGLKNKKRKEKVKQLLDNMKKGGDVTKLITKVDLGKILAIDKRDFSRARATYFGLERQKKIFSHKYSAKDFKSKLTGYKVVRNLGFLIFVGTVVLNVT